MTGKMKLSLVILLPAGALVFMACGKPEDAAGNAPKTESATSTSPAKDAKPSTANPDKVLVYYFHGLRRCPTCIGIQKTVEETVNNTFAKEIEAGLLEFEEINYEEPAGKPYVEKFQLSFSSMVVAANAGDKTVKWENANKVWDFAHAHDDLKAYVEESIRPYLKLIGAN